MPIKLVLLSFTLPLFFNPSLGQNPDSHQASLYVDSTGQVFVKANAPAYFFIAPADSTDKLVLIPSTDQAANPMVWDGEGSHYLVQRNAEGLPSVRFRILADGTAPSSKIKFDEGLVFLFEDSFFAETGFKASISAKDAMSGTKNSFFSINNEPFKLYNQPISIAQQGEFSIKFYSVDNVGNAEEPKEYKIITTADAIVRMDNIYFELNSTKLSAKSVLELNKLANILKQFPDIHLEIRAHSDSRGNANYNLMLSEQRAQVTVSYLASRGVSKNRLSAKGYGETMLLNECAKGVKCPEEKHKENRRVEFMITKLQIE